MEQEIGKRKVVTTILSNITSIVKGIVPIILIPLLLSEINQGFWYTFTSLAALASLADLGFMTIVGQFSAHEFSHLSLKKIFEGPDEYLDRISSLIKFIAKWVMFVSLVAFPIITIIGGCVLYTNGAISIWFAPWMIYMFGSLISFIASSFLSFFEGCNQISNIQINRIISNIMLIVSMALLMYLGFGLYSLSIPTCIGALSNCILLFVRFRKALMQLFTRKIEKKIIWKNSFLKLIWKYAISWASGYFMFQIYTPIAYMKFDPIQAGKVGITITLIQSCMGLANSWNTIVTPNMNIYAAKNQWTNMDKLEKKVFLLSLFSAIFGYSILIIFFIIFRDNFQIFDRFMGNTAIIILCFGFTCQLLMQSIAIYGRAHKIEPFLIPSVFAAIFILSSTLVFAEILSIDYFFLGFAIAEFISIIVFIIMYYKLRAKWHEKLLSQQYNNCQ